MESIKVKTKEDFLLVIANLKTDLKNNPSKWENKTLFTYLEAMQSWVEDMEGYYINNKFPIPSNVSWGVFSDILLAARIYEY